MKIMVPDALYFCILLIDLNISDYKSAIVSENLYLIMRKILSLQYSAHTSINPHK